MEYIKRKLDINGLIKWEELSRSLDYIDTLILKLIYYPRPQTLTFFEIYDHLNRSKPHSLGSRTTIRKRVEMLEEDMLIKIIKSKPLIIWPITGIKESNMRLLLKNLSILHRMETVE